MYILVYIVNWHRYYVAKIISWLFLLEFSRFSTNVHSCPKEEIMSTRIGSRTLLASLPAHPTMAFVRDQIQADPTMALKKRRETVSALSTMSKAVGRQLEDLPANPLYLWDLINKVLPVAAGVSELRWRNVRSLVRFALKQTGLAFVPGRYRDPLTPAWEEIFRLINDPRRRFSLSRLARYCGVYGITPEQVTDEVIGRFIEDLKTAGLGPKVRRIHRETCMLWNRAARGYAAWPKQLLTVPDYRDSYILPWSRFPEALKAEFDAYIRHLQGGDILEDVEFKPLRPASIKTRTIQLRQYLSALVHRGRNPQALGSLADVVAVATVKDGLRFFLERFGGKASKQMFEIACVVKTMARHWVKVADGHLTELKSVCRSIKQRLHGQTPDGGPTRKSMERLRQFQDQANVAALITLPQQLMGELPKAGKPSYREALQAQTALAIEILLMTPMRIGNLSRLDLERHIARPRAGGTVSLAIPSEEVKNDSDIDAPLPGETVALLDLYLSRYRPVLLKEPSTCLFPGKDSKKPKGIQSLGNQITKCLKRRCGLIVHPHLFRHIAALVYLTANPGAYGLMRLVLGHKSVQTTTQFYCGLEGPAALRSFDENILKLREQLAPLAAMRRLGRGK
jgi:site-specific recombinase XerD